MTKLFLNIINMSISTSWLVLAILLLRLLLKKAPKWINVCLWALVAVRLICPFSPESIFSLIPSAEVISPDIMMNPTPAINSGIPVINNTVNPIIHDAFAVTDFSGVNPLQLWLPLAAAFWCIGVAVMLVCAAVSYFRLCRRVSEAMLVRDNIYLCSAIHSPFILGIFAPKIYLPSVMNESDMSHVIAHECAHLRRRDHLWKPFGYLLLTIHWFNPLLWLAYTLLCRDIELACDESVIGEMTAEQKADYSQALLNCSIGRIGISACPLAFGEVSVKQRIQSVLHYKKPALWIIVAAVILCITTAVCFLTNPVSRKDPAAAVPGEVICLFNDETDWSRSMGSQVPGMTDITIQATRSVISISNPDGTLTTLMQGMPIRAAYFCDLNGDGVSELCASICLGSGFINEYIEVYDFSAQKAYVLQNRGTYDYSLSEESGVLLAVMCPLATNNIAAKGPLVLEKDTNTEDWKLSIQDSAGLTQPQTGGFRFADPDAADELTVYVWQMAKDSYSCHMVKGPDTALSSIDLIGISGIPLAEMRQVLASCDIPADRITVCGTYSPVSSYAFSWDEEKLQYVRQALGLE